MFPEHCYGEAAFKSLSSEHPQAAGEQDDLPGPGKAGAGQSRGGAPSPAIQLRLRWESGLGMFDLNDPVTGTFEEGADA